MVALKIFLSLTALVLIVLITGLFPTAALVVMALGIVSLFLIFKDVS